ncbi:hypothetical protein SAMN04488003_101124 [Loktanella fryxellensis]|uniref:Uncharacterized protein n=1 Tax=Loktanella fryxellensis TaxID=245187 RepID=A0A1H7YFH9_9RHOB|nr:hypothetical protein [Loktanella fryxellensis]SEM44077.1 hypothetical protein SAMN04488003_101124 [Loktanella fryxellensis]
MAETPEKVVALKLTPRAAPAQDAWHAQVTCHLAGIERLMRRLEWQVWALACGAAGTLVVQVLRLFTDN